MARKAHPWFRSSDGWWYIKVAGKQTKLARGRENKAEAFARWHTIMAELAANPGVDLLDQTVASVIDQYLSHIKPKRAPRTYASCHHYLQLFAEAHGFRAVGTCKPIHLTNWLDANPQWSSDWTIANVIGIVQRPFNWALRQRLITANPFQAVRHRTGAPRRAFTDREFRILLRATAPSRPTGKPKRKGRRRPTPGERFRQVLFFLRYTGARPGEMAALTWSDVHLEDGVIILHEHKTSRTQRTSRPRVIPLVPLVIKLLHRVKQQQPPGHDHVFLTAHHTEWNRNSLGLRMRRLRAKAGLPDDLKMYGIRHQFGTQSIVNGVDLKTLSELMGHTTTRVTEHYIHLAGHQAHLAAAMQRAVSPRGGS